MAKNVYQKTINIKCIGNLDVNDNGEYIVIVESNNAVEEINVNELLSSMVGSEINISSTEEVG